VGVGAAREKGEAIEERTELVGRTERRARRGQYLELAQLLKLAAQVAGAVLQATQVQLHLQTADCGGLTRRGATGRGWGRARYRGGPAASAA
jgi:hypothetical protein